MKRFAFLLLASVSAACASAPPAASVKAPSGPPFEQKMSWILRLEDQRVLRDPAPVVAPPAPAPVGKNQRPQPAAATPPPPPDLIRMLSDPEARIRRRAALAIGHVALAEGVTPLLPLLGDPDPEVRQMAAFALGLLGDTRARDPLVAALADPSPLVQGSAAEALGLIGDAADPCRRRARQVRRANRAVGRARAAARRGRRCAARYADGGLPPRASRRWCG